MYVFCGKITNNGAFLNKKRRCFAIICAKMLPCLYKAIAQSKSAGLLGSRSNLEELNLEDEGRTARDVLASATVAIGEV